MAETPIKIISLVRNPFEREVSDFFENLDFKVLSTTKSDNFFFTSQVIDLIKKEIPLLRDSNFDTFLCNKSFKTLNESSRILKEKLNKNDQEFIPHILSFGFIFSTEKLIYEFLKHTKHIGSLSWFDKEINNYLGIDTFSYPFHQKEGFQRIKNDNIDFLLIKCELSNSSKEKIIEEYLNIKDFKIENSNVHTKKYYSIIYQKFKEQFLAFQVFNKKIQNSKFYQHFYSDDFIE